MQVTLQMILTVCPLILFASCMDAIAGGGGLISLPAYYLAGLPPVLASGSNKFSASFGTLIATTRFLREKKVLLVPGLLAVAGAFPGSYLGAELLKHTPEQVVRIFMLVAIPVVAVIMLVKPITKVEPKLLTKARLVGCFFIGLTCGFYDGFFGPGTGTFLIMLFTFVAGMDVVSASGTAKLVNLSSNAAALVSFLTSGQVLFALAIPAMICSMIGGYIGAQLALTKGAKFIRYVMMFVLAMLIAKLVYDFVM